MYSDLARAVLLADSDELDLEIQKYREAHPGADAREIARGLTAKTALRCAAVGAIASIPAGFLAGLPLAADVSYQVRSLNRLALSIARANRRPTTPVERGAAAIGALVLAGAARSFRAAFLKGAHASLGRRAPKLVPLAGALAGAASGALAAWAAGRIAGDVFGSGRRRLW
jgi:hypothetical protein